MIRTSAPMHLFAVIIREYPRLEYSTVRQIHPFLPAKSLYIGELLNAWKNRVYFHRIRNDDSHVSTTLFNESEIHACDQASKIVLINRETKGAIQYNSNIVVSNIPAKAYEYIINAKSAIEWIMERYQVKQDKASGITNDPNHWSEEVQNERYILDLLLSIVSVSVQTIDIVNDLPKVKFE